MWNDKVFVDLIWFSKITYVLKQSNTGEYFNQKDVDFVMRLKFKSKIIIQMFFLYWQNYEIH